MMNKIIYLTIFIISFLSCKRDAEIKSQYLEKLKSDKIDNLANRYLDLNRFSGTILIVKDEDVVYNQYFGLADYENKTVFSNKIAFKIGEITVLVTDNIINRLVKKKNSS